MRSTSWRRKPASFPRKTPGVTRKLTADLQNSLDALLAVKSDADEFLGIVTSEKAELERGVVVVGDKLARLGERVQSRSAEVRREFEAAHRETRDLLDGLEFPSLVASCFNPAECLCESLLAATTGHARTTDLLGEASARLESDGSGDTMRRDAATPVTTALPGADAAADAPDGIELFTASEPPPAPAVESLGSEAAGRTGGAAPAGSAPAPADAGENAAMPGPPAAPESPEAAPPTPESPEFGDGIQLF